MTRQAANASNLGDGDLQMNVLRQRIAADARDVQSRILLARAYQRRGYPDLALEHYRLASTQFPESAAAALGLARTLQAMGEGATALKGLTQFLESHPGDWEVLSLRGVLEDEQGEWSQAETSHRAALAANGKSSVLHNNLGYNLFRQAKTEEAIPELRRAVELDPQSLVARNNLAMALSQQPGSAAREALGEWQRSAGEAAAHNNLGAALIEQGRMAEARDELSEALRLRPAFREALSNWQLASQDQPPAASAAKSAGGFWSKLGSIFGKRGTAASASTSPAGAGSGK